MTTSEAVLTVVGELRTIVAAKEDDLRLASSQRDALIEENAQLRRELIFLKNSVKNLSEDLMKGTEETRTK